MFNALEIANYFIKLAKEEGKHITNMQLQKLVFISHGFFLAKQGVPLIDEYIQAWEHGTVVPSIYHAFKKYGSSYIKDYHVELEEISDHSYTPMISNKDVRSLLEFVWKSFSGFTAIELSMITHLEGSPWSVTVERNGGNEKIIRGKSIDNSIIKEYYSKKISEVGG